MHHKASEISEIIARGAPNGKGLEHQSRRVIKAQRKWNNKREKKVLDVEARR